MNVEQEFKNFVNGGAEQSTNNEGAENVKTEAEENGTQASTDSTEYERELTDKEIDQIIRDSYKWYAGNGERLLGREEYRRRRVMTDKEFVALIKELEARFIEADVSNPFPLEALPPVIKNLAVSFSKTWEVPAETVAMPMISVISASLGQGLAASDGKRRTYGNTFAYVSLSTGGFKTAALDEAMKPIIGYNEKRKQEFKDDIYPSSRARLAEIEQEIKSIKELVHKNGPTSDTTADLTELYKEEAEEKEKQKFWSIHSSDFTIEALARKGASLRTLFVATDEASIVESIIAGRYSEGFTNEGFFCKIFSVSSYERERVRDEESISTPAICGAMLLMGQPHITKKMFQNEQMQMSGFIPRFLFSEILTELNEENRNAPPINEEHRKQYNELVIQFLRDFWPKKDEKTVVINFTEEALDLLHEFRTEMVKSKYANRIASLDGVIARLKEQAMRLSVVFHAASIGKNAATDAPGIGRAINVETVQSAIAIVRWSFGQYMSYNASTHAEELDAIESKVLKFVKDKKEAGAREVSRKFKGDIGSARKAEVVLQKLAEKGLVAEIPAEEGTIGRPKSPRYTAK